MRRRYTSQPGARGAVSGSCAARRPPHPDEHDQPGPSTGGRDMRSGHGSGPLSYCTRTAVSVQPCLPRELLYTARVLYSYLCLSATMPTTRTPVHHTCTVLLPLCMPTRTLVLRADFNASAVMAVATAAVACTMHSGLGRHPGLGHVALREPLEAGAWEWGSEGLGGLFARRHRLCRRSTQAYY